MRSSLVVVILCALACTKAREATPTTGSAGSGGSAVDPVTPNVAVMPVPVKDGIAIPANHPTSGILVTNLCSLSPHPPSTFYWSTISVYDLDAAAWTSQHTEGSERTGPMPRPGKPDPEAPKVTASSGALAADKLATIRSRFAELLAGGPYPPKYPQSGGSRCTLSLTAKGGEAFFSIDRADREIDDEVTRLMAAL